MIAGEASGDMIGATLIHGLRQRWPSVQIEGIGGPAMEQAGGFRSLFPLTDLAHIGLWATLRHLPLLRRRFYETIAAIHATPYQALITVDAPEFCLRISQRVAGYLPRIHCVAPTVWAWRPGRAKKLPRQTDHVLSIFPFEPALLAPMPCDFVGHPILEAPAGIPERFFARYPHLAQKPLICLLPGSRPQEIRKFWPIFHQTAQLLHQQCPQAQFLVITLPYLRPLLQDIPYPILDDVTAKRDAFAAATAALAASGTVGLELAAEGTPMVVGYQVSPLTGWLMKRLLRVPFVSIVNILAQRPLVPECLQDRFCPSILAEELATLMREKEVRDIQKRGFKEVISQLTTPQLFSNMCTNILEKLLKR